MGWGGQQDGHRPSALPDLVVAQAQHLQGPEAQEALWDGLQLVVVQEQLGQGGLQAQEGHALDAVLTRAIVGKMQDLQARLHVREHIAGDALDAVVVQCQAAEAPGQEGGHVHQPVVRQVQGFQLPAGPGVGVGVASGTRQRPQPKGRVRICPQMAAATKAPNSWRGPGPVWLLCSPLSAEAGKRGLRGPT